MYNANTSCRLKALPDLDEKLYLFSLPLNNFLKLFTAPLKPSKYFSLLSLAPHRRPAGNRIQFCLHGNSGSSTIYSRTATPPLLGDRTVLAAATPELPSAPNNSFSLDLETPLPLTASTNYQVIFSRMGL